MFSILTPVPSTSSRWKMACFVRMALLAKVLRGVYV